VKVGVEWFLPYHWTDLRGEAQELSGLFCGNRFIVLIEFGDPVKLLRKTGSD
jgi:hypothetical protein